MTEITITTNENVTTAIEGSYCRQVGQTGDTSHGNLGDSIQDNKGEFGKQDFVKVQENTRYINKNIQPIMMYIV